MKNVVVKRNALALIAAVSLFMAQRGGVIKRYSEKQEPAPEKIEIVTLN